MLKKILFLDNGWRLFLSSYRLRLVAWVAAWSAYLARGPPVLAQLPLIVPSYGLRAGLYPIRPLIPLATGPSQVGTVESMAGNSI